LGFDDSSDGHGGIAWQRINFTYVPEEDYYVANDGGNGNRNYLWSNDTYVPLEMPSGPGTSWIIANVSPSAAVPEPASITLVLTGFGALMGALMGYSSLRRRQAAA
jgi:hypothetical protein